MYKEYLESSSATNNIVLQLNGDDEIGKLALSDKRWALDKSRRRYRDKFLKGEVYQFEFGKNFIPEMSYEHRGLIIGVNNKMLYVLPIYSYDNNLETHRNAYHPIDNLDEKQDFYLLKSSEYRFIKHNSVMKLNDLRSISVNRMIYKQKGRIDINSEIYKKIEDLVIQKHFNQYHYLHTALKMDYEILQHEYEKIKLENESLVKKVIEYEN